MNARSAEGRFLTILFRVREESLCKILQRNTRHNGESTQDFRPRDRRTGNRRLFDPVERAGYHHRNPEQIRCLSTPSATCSASRPLARATGPRSAAWSMAVRRGFRSTAAEIQRDLDRRRPGQSKFTTQRQEPDAVRILSGVFADEASGAGRHHRHADRAADRQCRSALEGLFEDQGQVPARTCRLHLRRQIRRARFSRRRARVGARNRGAGRGRRHRAQDRAGHDRARRPWCRWARTRSIGTSGTGTRSATIRSSVPMRPWRNNGQSYLDGVRTSGSSIGAVIEVMAENVPPGLGAPVYGKLDAEIASAMMGINAVKGVEIGDGFAAAMLSGEENADEMRMGNDGKPRFLSNHAGGILGGISTGQPIVDALCGEADVVDSEAAPDRRQIRHRNRDRDHRPPRSLRRHPRGAGRRSHAGMRARGSLSASSRTDGRRAGMAVPARRMMPKSVKRFSDNIMRESKRKAVVVSEQHRTIEAAIAAFARGEIVVVTDDDDRENEGDLVMAAVHATPEKMAFIIRNTAGIVCAPLPLEHARRLRLDPMVSQNDSPHHTAFTVSVDYAHGTTTGISAEDRTATVRNLANGNAGANDFVRPGHVFPLIAKEGGVLMRSGHTEAAVDLCKLARLEPVGVICELVNDDGTVMRGPQIAAFSEKHKLHRVSVADLIAYREAREKLVERVGEFPVASPIGTLQGFAFVTPFDPQHHMAFVHGTDRRRPQCSCAPASRRRDRRRVRRRQDHQCDARPLQGRGPRRAGLSARRHRRRAGDLHSARGQKLRRGPGPAMARNRARRADSRRISAFPRSACWPRRSTLMSALAASASKSCRPRRLKAESRPCAPRAGSGNWPSGVSPKERFAMHSRVRLFAALTLLVTLLVSAPLIGVAQIRSAKPRSRSPACRSMSSS